GDTKNGQYYTGSINFTTTGSTATVQLLDGITLLPTTFYTFVTNDHAGFQNLLIADSVQETLRVSATDYITPVPVINPKHNNFSLAETLTRGYPGAPTRAVPVPSSPDVVTAGIVVTPEDLSPVPSTDPTYAHKQTLLSTSKWAGKTSINQGDGSIN